MSYYSPGDEVLYTPGNYKAKVIRHTQNDHYIVEFEKKDLIPPQMEVPGYTLVPALPYTSNMYGVDSDWGGVTHGTTSSINKETHCPKCGGPWKETVFFRKTYYDCLKCNLKKEDA